MDTQRAGHIPQHSTRWIFLMGPIPWPWLLRAMSCGGPALKISLAIWLMVGVKRSRILALSNKLLAELGLTRHGKYRGLGALEAAGLIRVTQKAGRAPIVEVIEGGDSQKIQAAGDPFPAMEGDASGKGGRLADFRSRFGLDNQGGRMMPQGHPKPTGDHIVVLDDQKKSGNWK